jgi:hypothetical protein
MTKPKHYQPALRKPAHTQTRYQYAVTELRRHETGERTYSASYVAALRRIVKRGDD